MKEFRVCLFVLFAAANMPAATSPAPIAIDYPAEASVFPPDIAAPTFLWRDPSPAVRWRIEIRLSPGAPIEIESAGDLLQVGVIDPACVGAVPPKLTPEQAASHTWKPAPEIWTAIKSRSVSAPGAITVTGYPNAPGADPISRGQVSLRTSRDPVGAPIFYRDVPLIPSPTVNGVIKPLPNFAIGLIAWRLRNIAEPQSKIVMQGLPTCANCHSFSLDGKTLGLDVDGPQNDKGLYALVPVRREMSIRNEDLIRWSSFRGVAPTQTSGPRPSASASCPRSRPTANSSSPPSKIPG